MAWKEDHAVSAVMGEVLLIALAIVAGGVVYTLASHRPPEVPSAMAVTAGPAVGPDRDISVQSATHSLRWMDVRVELDGVTLAYDEHLADGGTWCRLSAGDVCMASDALDASALVRGGDALRVHHESIAGKTLQMRDAGANALLVSYVVR